MSYLEKDISFFVLCSSITTQNFKVIFISGSQLTADFMLSIHSWAQGPCGRDWTLLYSLACPPIFKTKFCFVFSTAKAKQTKRFLVRFELICML